MPDTALGIGGQGARNPLDNRPQQIAPQAYRLSELMRQRSEDPHGSISPLDEVVASEYPALDESQEPGVNFRAHRLHDVDRQRVPSPQVCMQHAQPRIETHCEAGEAPLSFAECVEVVEDGVGRVACRARIVSQR